MIRATIRLFASCPLDGGFDLSWHDLYHSYSEVGNQNDYSSHFIKSLAAKEGAIIPVPQPIVVPIVGSLGNLEEKKGSVADDDSDDEGVRSAALTPPPAEDEEPELVVLRRLLYTRDPGMVFMDKKMTLDDYRAALFAQTSSNLLSLKVGWHELGKCYHGSTLLTAVDVAVLLCGRVISNIAMVDVELFSCTSVSQTLRNGPARIN